MRQKRPSLKDAFTLVEMVVVLGIMMVLSTMLIAYNRSNERRVLIFTEQAKLAGVLNRAKSLALQKLERASGATVCALGIHLEKTAGRMVVFEDRDANESACKNPARVFSYDNGEEVESVSLDGNIELAEDYADILFLPPYLIVKSDDLAGGGSLILTLRIKNQPLYTARVEVNAGGQITTLYD